MGQQSAAATTIDIIALVIVLSSMFVYHFYIYLRVRERSSNITLSISLTAGPKFISKHLLKDSATDTTLLIQTLRNTILLMIFLASSSFTTAYSVLANTNAEESMTLSLAQIRGVAVASLLFGAFLNFALALRCASHIGYYIGACVGKLTSIADLEAARLTTSGAALFGPSPADPQRTQQELRDAVAEAPLREGRLYALTDGRQHLDGGFAVQLDMGDGGGQVQRQQQQQPLRRRSGNVGEGTGEGGMADESSQDEGSDNDDERRRRRSGIMESGESTMQEEEQKTLEGGGVDHTRGRPEEEGQPATSSFLQLTNTSSSSILPDAISSGQVAASSSTIQRSENDTSLGVVRSGGVVVGNRRATTATVPAERNQRRVTTNGSDGRRSASISNRWSFQNFGRQIDHICCGWLRRRRNRRRRQLLNNGGVNDDDSETHRSTSRNTGRRGEAGTTTTTTTTTSTIPVALQPDSSQRQHRRAIPVGIVDVHVSAEAVMAIQADKLMSLLTLHVSVGFRCFYLSIPFAFFGAGPIPFLISSIVMFFFLVYNDHAAS